MQYAGLLEIVIANFAKVSSPVIGEAERKAPLATNERDTLAVPPSTFS